MRGNSFSVSGLRHQMLEMNAVTSDPFTGSDLAAFISETWTPIVNTPTFAKTVFQNFCTDLSAYATGGSDIFHVPNMYTNKLTLGTQSTQGAEITTASPAQTDTTLTVNTHNFVAFIIGDKDMAQIASMYDANRLYAEEARELCFEAVEQALAALWSSLSTNTIGDTATVLNDAEIRQGIEKLATAKYDLRECAFFFHPYVYWVQLAANSKYYDQTLRGGVNMPSLITSGQLGGNGAVDQYAQGTLYGIPVFVTPNVVSGLLTYRNLLLHKSAFGYAIQTKGGNKVRVQAENAIRNLGVLTVVDILFGVAVLREEAAVLLNAATAFIGS